MWFRKDPDAVYYAFIAESARRDGDSDVVVQQKVDAERARISERRAAQQAYYDGVVAKALAAGDDFITAEWKLDVARAERWRDWSLDQQRGSRQSSARLAALLRDSANSQYSGERLTRELRKIEAEYSDKLREAEQAEKNEEAGYRRGVKKAGVRWLFWTAVFRLFAALMLGVFATLLIQDALEWVGLVQGRSSIPFVWAIAAIAILAMPIERYATHAWTWFERVVAFDRVQNTLIIAISAFLGALSIFPDYPRRLQVGGWIILACGCVLTSVAAKRLPDVPGWEELRNFAKSLPGGAVLFVITVIVETLAFKGYEHSLFGLPMKDPDQEAMRFAFCIGGPILVTWWLWIKWWAPANRPKNLSVSGLIGGAADTAGRGKMLVIGLWFAALGFFLLWLCGPILIMLLSPPAAAPIVWLLPAIGTAVGAYLFFARGLGPIWNAISWSRLSEDTHGEARTATAGELRDGGLIPRGDGIYLGRYLNNDVASDAVGYPGGVHLITIGPAGSGKGTGIIVPNLATLRRSILIIDPKGEAAAITARKRAQFGRVLIINPFNVLSENLPHLKSQGFNPLAALDPEDDNFTDDCVGIGQALVQQPQQRETGGNAAFFAGSAQDLVTALIMHEKFEERDKASLANVRRMLMEPYAQTEDGEPLGLRKTVEEMLESKCGPLRSTAGRFTRGSKSVMDIIQTAANETRFLNSPPLQRDLQGEDFDWNVMKREITTVYLILPADRLESHANYLRLVVTSALRTLLRSPPSATLPPVLLMLDEFAQLGYLPPIENAMGIARGFGVQLWPFLQDLNQINSLYKERWQTFIGNAAVLTAFAPRDLFTARYLSERCGHKTVIVESENERTGAAGMGRSRGPQGVPLFRPEILMEMPAGQLLSFVDPVKKPFMTQAKGYWQTDFRFGLDDNPYSPQRR
jgi:type IV secretion system protein VirD4